MCLNVFRRPHGTWSDWAGWCPNWFSLVISHLDEGNSKLHGIRKKDLQQLQKIQNWETRFLHGLKKSDFVTTASRESYWLKVEFHVQYIQIVDHCSPVFVGKPPVWVAVNWNWMEYKAKGPKNKLENFWQSLCSAGTKVKECIWRSSEGLNKKLDIFKRQTNTFPKQMQQKILGLHVCFLYSTQPFVSPKQAKSSSSSSRRWRSCRRKEKSIASNVSLKYLAWGYKQVQRKCRRQPDSNPIRGIQSPTR